MITCQECGRTGTQQFYVMEDGTAVCKRRDPCLDRQGKGRGRFAKLSPEAKERHRERSATYVKNNPSKHAEYRRRSYWRAKLDAIRLLGGCCVGCGTSNPLVLSVNHRHGGTSGRNRVTGAVLYRQVVEDPALFRDDLDLRCLNCQLLYEYETGRLSLPQSEEFAAVKGWLDASRPIS